jgi:DNA-binding MarR family transcriptional regulator
VTTDDASLAETFWAVARRLRHRTKIAFEPWDLSPSVARALGVLAGHGEMRLSTLADKLRIVPRSATEVVDDLQSSGLVSRRPDPADRRAVLVALTAEGDRINRAIQEARQAEGARFFAALSAADREDLARVLGKLASDGSPETVGDGGHGGS